MIKHAEPPAAVPQGRGVAPMPLLSPELSGVFAACLAQIARQQQATLIGVTSSVSGEGVTTVTRGLSMAAELAGRSVYCLPRHLDSAPWHAEEKGSGDRKALPARSPAEHSTLTTADQAGRGNRIAGVPEDEMEAWLHELRSTYDYVFIDLPPVSAGLQPMAAHLDGVLLVVAAESTRPETSRAAAAQLQLSGIPILGTLLNKRRSFIPQWLYNLI